MNIIGKTILLRAIEAKDLESLKNMMNDPNNEKYVLGWSYPVSDVQQVKWFENIQNSNSEIRFAIEANEKFVGTCILSNIDWKNRSLGINIKILDSFKNKGYGKESIKLLLKYCYEELNINRIEANILEYNVPSKKLFEKCGFVTEGKKRKAIYKNNEYNDVIIYSILKEDYDKNAEG